MAFLTPNSGQFLLPFFGTYLLLIGLLMIVIIRDQRATISTRIIEIIVLLFIPILGLILVGGNRFFNFLVKRT